MFTIEDIYGLLLTAPTLLLSLTIHEYAHARTALAFGDPTAKLNGRVTFNPLAHLDPIGTIVLLVTRFIGWARPVPVNPFNLQPRRLGEIAVSLAGPLSNLSLAIICGVLLRGLLALGTTGGASGPAGLVRQMLTWTLVANVGLCVFNLIPLFPLDGHHVLREILPSGRRDDFMAWQIRYGAILLMVLVFVPRLLSTVTKTEIFDPIFWLREQGLALVVRVVFWH